MLLNIKKNLQDSRRLEYFLKNPDKPFLTGDNGIDGHINRIRRYAQEHYSNGYLDVVPVMLLAAQLARQEEDKKQASKLMEASRIKDFEDLLRMAIIDYGAIGDRKLYWLHRLLNRRTARLDQGTSRSLPRAGRNYFKSARSP